ncbi:oligopeptide ABC transporter permease OppB [Govanella unica]|uniref:Oligopeptide ABC transporter permease OppB n=1 Tax=Govanella unica TaxID=2975056 RepID=A0A9X3TVS9_9PROT|nr:oligopeptide ABC transporter permease OppB [Govania unica]MDA5192906.1 oligopeptide ABC transporter permease OppB [Govania unica]
MVKYIIDRLMGAVPTFLVIITGAFFLMRLAPGGPFDDLADLPPEVLANIHDAYNLNEPLLSQYLHFIKNAVTGNLGPSFSYPDYNVSELLAIGLPVSIRLGLTAITIAVIIGSLIGIWAALRQNTKIDYTVMAVAMTGVAVPNFVIAPLMMLLFGVYLKLLPISGWNNGALAYMVLPVTALAIPKIAIIARLMRGSMLEILRSDYIRTARAKGMPERVVITRHALKAAALPLVSYLGPSIAAVMTGSVVVEVIFGLPGVGRYFVYGAINRDYPLVMGIVVFYATAIILLNLLVDILYGFLDPRVRQDKKS